ncbi:hypothetical protein [Psychrosphaera saromensis]|nr:hypothetical protein [Psychrosphaera saromensis]
MRLLLVILTFISFNSLADGFVFDSWSSKGKSCMFQFIAPPNLNWNGDSDLPLTIKEVDTIFQKWALGNLKGNEKAHVVSFNLSSVAPEGLKNNYWIFKVGYVVFNGNVPSKQFNRKLVIDLTGKVIEPICRL